MIDLLGKDETKLIRRESTLAIIGPSLLDKILVKILKRKLPNTIGLKSSILVGPLTLETKVTKLEFRP